MAKWTVRKTGRTWGVYRFEELIEGGFFSKEKAIDAKIQYMAEERD